VLQNTCARDLIHTFRFRLEDQQEESSSSAKGYFLEVDSADSECVSRNRSFNSFLLRHTATPMRQHHHG
jgi:hypothetical protein